MELKDVLSNPPKPHRDKNGSFMVMGLIEPALRVIYENVDRSCTTLETGCGLSTVVFALTGSRHTVVAPAPAEFEIVTDYCAKNGISTGQITFIAEPSQKVLPTLDLPPLDLMLIDGGHGFPTPYIDWFYTAGKLKNGGLLMVDDVWLWSCDILRSFLAEQPQWELVAEFEQRVAIFKKIAAGSEWLEWTQQPRVARGGRLKWIDGEIRLYDSSPNDVVDKSTAFQRALGDLKRGDFKALVRKTARRIF